MQWLVNLLRGYVEVEVYGAFPERLLNLCAQNGVGFWNLRWVDATTFRFTVSFRAYRQLNKLAQRAMCELPGAPGTGTAALALGFRKRYAFVAGLALCILTLSVLSQFILVVDVEGNETVPTAVILEELERLGLKVGAYGPAWRRRRSPTPPSSSWRSSPSWPSTCTAAGQRCRCGRPTRSPSCWIRPPRQTLWPPRRESSQR